jgi:hypothetical protein
MDSLEASFFREKYVFSEKAFPPPFKNENFLFLKKDFFLFFFNFCFLGDTFFFGTPFFYGIFCGKNKFFLPLNENLFFQKKFHKKKGVRKKSFFKKQ